MHSGIFRLTGLLYAQWESAQTMASFLLTVKLMTVIVDFSKAPFYSKIPRMAKNAASNWALILAMAQRGFFLSSLIFVAAVIFFGLSAEWMLGLISSNTSLCSTKFWAVLGMAYFVERYAAMHLNLYTISNHIIWHRVYLVSGTLYLGLLLLLYSPLRLFAFPVSMLIAELCYSSWCSARHSLRLFDVGFLEFEKRVSALPFALMCAYVCYVFVS